MANEPKEYPQQKGLVSRGKKEKPPPDPSLGMSADKPIVSAQGAVCPHCKEVAYRGHLGTDGLSACVNCKKHFRWEATQGEKGFAWKTWRKEEGQQSAKKPEEKPASTTPGIIGPSTK